jgi:hypothetical protein
LLVLLVLLLVLLLLLLLLPLPLLLLLLLLSHFLPAMKCHGQLALLGYTDRLLY